MNIQRVKLSELVDDPNNANLGTDRGRSLLLHSISSYGFLEPGVLDRNNVIISGNKRRDAAKTLGSEEAIIIDHDGHTPIYIRVPDFDINDPSTHAREAAYALNRVGQLNLRWDADQIEADISSGLHLDPFFDDRELLRITGSEDAPANFEEVDEDEIPVEHCCPKCGYQWS